MENLARGLAAREEGVTTMSLKPIALVVIAGLSVLLIVGLHEENRADAAAGNCYTSAKGPSSPTLCQ